MTDYLNMTPEAEAALVPDHIIIHENGSWETPDRTLPCVVVCFGMLIFNVSESSTWARDVRGFYKATGHLPRRVESCGGS